MFWWRQKPRQQPAQTAPTAEEQQLFWEDDIITLYTSSRAPNSLYITDGITTTTPKQPPTCLRQSAPARVDAIAEKPFGLRVGEKEYLELSGGDFLALLVSYIEKAGWFKI